MRHKTFYPIALSCAFLTLSCGSCLIGCNEDDEANDVIRYTLAEEQMTRAGEGSYVQPSKPVKRDTSVVYKEIDTTFTQPICASVDCQVHISCQGGFNDQVNPSADVKVVDYESFFGIAKADVNKKYFANGSVYIDYTVVLDNPKKQSVTFDKGTYLMSASVTLHKDSVANM